MYIVSACLAGVRCRYNGEGSNNGIVTKLVEEGRAISVCPEVLGGLEIPRMPCEIVNQEGEEKVLTKEGDDFTDKFILGAQKTLEIAKVVGAKVAILKARSPSCGYGQVYNGNFSGKLVEGNGFTAQLLVDNGLKIYTEEELEGLSLKV
ncbi:DUF523 domain-containing protein [Halonatronum saccharophilum]|uniref:DUF523 domain-containing protein n=1 Tax=Halonatronum saccharophilum TaxID=150060 RepID=UPI0004855F84|nr:DUF523 domain-containing protein [Halonatronum saccharophilum]